MPLFDFLCIDCGKPSGILIAGSGGLPKCKNCGSHNLKKLLSAHSSLSGLNKDRMPGPGLLAVDLPPARPIAPGSCCRK